MSVLGNGNTEVSGTGVSGLFTILVVCTGNICRSPLAEQVLRSKLAAAGIEARVGSAGTRALVGHDMAPQSAVQAQRLGVVPAVHAARLLTRNLIEEADLVLTATREHRSASVALLPRANRYAYTLTQFARLTTAQPRFEPWAAHGGNDHDRLTSALAEVHASRGFHPSPIDLSVDDIADPYRQSDAIYERVGTEIEVAVAVITRAFAAWTAR